MPYGYQFLSKSKIATLAREYAPNNPDTEYRVGMAQAAYDDHKTAQESFLEFLKENNEKEDN